LTKNIDNKCIESKNKKVIIMTGKKNYCHKKNYEVEFQNNLMLKDKIEK
jgi:hypothetical protein